MAVNEGPFAGVANITEVVSAAAQTEILGEIDKIIALIPDTTEGSSPAPTPHFDKMDPRLGVTLRAELDALKTAIDAAPTA